MADELTSEIQGLLGDMNNVSKPPVEHGSWNAFARIFDIKGQKIDCATEDTVLWNIPRLDKDHGENWFISFLVPFLAGRMPSNYCGGVGHQNKLRMECYLWSWATCCTAWTQLLTSPWTCWHIRFPVLRTIFTLSPPCPAWSKGGKSTGLYATDGWDFLEITHLCQLGNSLACIFECSDDVDKRKHFIHIDHAMQLAGFKKVLSQNVSVHELSHNLRTRWFGWERMLPHPQDLCHDFQWEAWCLGTPTSIGSSSRLPWKISWSLMSAYSMCMETLDKKRFPGPQTRQQVTLTWLKNALTNAGQRFAPLTEVNTIFMYRTCKPEASTLPWLWPGCLEVFRVLSS